MNWVRVTGAVVGGLWCGTAIGGFVFGALGMWGRYNRNSEAMTISAVVYGMWLVVMALLTVIAVMRLESAAKSQQQRPTDQQRRD